MKHLSHIKYQIHVNYDLNLCQIKIDQVNASNFNPNVTNGLSHPYHLDKSTFIFRGIGSNFSFHFSMNIM